jgi:hypothetical protein
VRHPCPRMPAIPRRRGAQTHLRLASILSRKGTETVQANANFLFWVKYLLEAVRFIYAGGRRTVGLSSSDTRSDQQVPIAPDPGTDDAGQIAEVRKHHIGLWRCEAKLDFPGH